MKVRRKMQSKEMRVRNQVNGEKVSHGFSLRLIGNSVIKVRLSGIVCGVGRTAAMPLLDQHHSNSQRG